MSFNIKVCQFDVDDRKASYESGSGKYTKRWKVMVDTRDLCGAEVLEKAITSTLPVGSDAVPFYGSPYTHGTFTDNFVFATSFECWLEDPDDDYNWTIQVEYSAPGKGGGSSKEDSEKAQKENPLDWDPIYYTDWVEEQKVVEWATLIQSGRFYHDEDDIPGGTDPDDIQTFGDVFFVKSASVFPWINRGDAIIEPWSGDPVYREPGPIVNTAGQQTIDPISRPEFHPVLVCKRNYPSAINSIQMNSFYLKTMNSTTFLGDPPRTWRYVISQADEPQQKQVTVAGSETDPDTKATITYYPTITKLEFNKMTWDLFVLNNGMSCFRYEVEKLIPILDPRSNGLVPMLFPAVVKELKETVVLPTTSESEATTFTIDDFVSVLASEPVNLADDGRPVHELFDSDDPNFKMALHLQYRDYTEVDFNTIPAFLELVAEYEAFTET